MTTHIYVDPRTHTPAELTTAIAEGIEIAIEPDEYSLDLLSCPECEVWVGCAHVIDECLESDEHMAMAPSDEHKPGCPNRDWQV